MGFLNQNLLNELKKFKPKLPENVEDEEEKELEEEGKVEEKEEEESEHYGYMPGRPEHNRNRLLELQHLGFGENSISFLSPNSNRRAEVSAKTQA